jgi:hypothetical protein
MRRQGSLFTVRREPGAALEETEMIRHQIEPSFDGITGSMVKRPKLV